MKKNRFLLLIFALVAFGPTSWAWSGDGSNNDPYLITSTTDWNTLATNVNAGTSYSGKIFKLTADITVSEMVGTDANRFSGTFDGDGHTLTFNKGASNDRFSEPHCGPFRYIKNATFKRLHVAGTIYTSNQFAGVVGRTDGTNYFNSCHSSLIIDCSKSGDGTNGGFIGVVEGSCTYFTNCLFDGQLLGSSSENNGGFCGWSEKGVMFTNCLFAPESVTFSASDSKTFSRGRNVNISNCYYKSTYGDTQGATDAINMSNDNLLTKLGEAWQISGEKVVPLIQIKTLTGSGTTESPYLIASATDWNNFAFNVSVFGDSYSGNYFKMTANITVSDMVGTDANPFKGTFDGGGHILDLNITDQTNQGTAPFRYISGATIRFVKTTGTVNGAMHCSGLVGFAKDGSTNFIRNCEVAVTVSCGGSNHTHCGGVLGHGKNSNTTIVNCLFSGNISGATDTVGVIYGWGDNSGTHTIENCLSTGTCNGASTTCLIAERGTHKTHNIINCYRTTSNVSQGNAANGMTNETLVANLGTGWEERDNKVVPVMSLRSWSGEGTQESPYLIASATDWDILASNVSDFGETYENKYFVLDTANITVSTMVGTAGNGVNNINQCNYFGGVFDGQGKTLTFNKTAANDDLTAPFRCVYGATIQNLKVEGTINGGSYKLCAGLVGDSYGATIRNCVSNVNIIGNYEDATHGGFIARNSRNATHLYGCAFTGSMSGNGKSCGGFVGWTAGNQDAHVYFHDCIYAPSSNTMGTNGSATYSRGYDNNTQNILYDNCYYTQPFGTVQGKQTRSITRANNIVTLAFAGNATEYNVSGITTCGTGLQYGSVLYAGSGDNVSLNITASVGYAINTVSYTYEGGSETTINPVDGVYSFTMPNTDVTINAETAYCVNYWANGDGSSDYPFEITNTDDFDMLSTLVREVPEGHPFYTYGPGQIFYGYNFILIDDLDYTSKTFTPVGYYNSSSNYRGFGGSFDGKGHVIKGINYVTDKSAGIFGFANGDISNLALVSSNLTGGNNTGGIVGYYNGGTISNCHVASDVNIYTPTGSAIVGFHGGIVGRKYAGNIYYCTSAAHIVDGCTTYGNHFGGIAGSNDSGIKSIKYCLFTNDIVTTVHTDNKGPIAGSGSGTLENCYWTNPSFEGSSPSANNDNSGFINTINALQSRMTVATYSDDFKALAPYGYTLQKTISAWNNNVNPVGGWYLIASPVVGDIAPGAVVNLLGTQIQDDPVLYDYDLYRFNQSPTVSSDGKYKEWENYHQHNTQQNPFRLVNGKGYLYARNAETTLTFTGTFNTNDEQKVGLIYDQDSPHSDTRGWNLVGNPLADTAYIDCDFYVMKDDGSDIIAAVRTNNYVKDMEGIFVCAEAEYDSVTFTAQKPSKGRAQKPEPKQLVLNLSRDRGSIIDRAIVRMGEGQTLPKFQIRENSTKLYIPQGGKDYAIAYSDGYGEMSVNFRANENGEYTLTVNPENVEMTYLHLIDNMTGADVDLLALRQAQGPANYTFTAKTTDYESRFKLVFSANNNGDGASTGSATFAFYSNGSWIIANEGQATLQIIDLNGRILSSETVNGSVSKSINATPGVYMIRLINGENVKVQKIVVR